MKIADAAGTVRTLVLEELAAIAAYRLVLERDAEGPRAPELRRIENDHEEAAALLQEQLAGRGVEPPTRSEAWRVEGIIAFRDAEERAVQAYEGLLSSALVDDRLKELVRLRVLPKMRAHVPALERLILQ